MSPAHTPSLAEGTPALWPPCCSVQTVCWQCVNANTPGWRMALICYRQGYIPAQPTSWCLSALGETWYCSPSLWLYPLKYLKAAVAVPLSSDFCWLNYILVCRFLLLFFHSFIMSVKITHLDRGWVSACLYKFLFLQRAEIYLDRRHQADLNQNTGDVKGQMKGCDLQRQKFLLKSIKFWL